jgi:hypothetical protein
VIEPDRRLGDAMPEFSQRKLSGRAVEQPRAQALLKPRDGARNRRNRYGQRTRCARKGPFFHDLGEHRESFEIRQPRHKYSCNNEFQSFLF